MFTNFSASDLISIQNQLLTAYLADPNNLLSPDDITDLVSITTEHTLFITQLKETWVTLQILKNN